MATWLPIPGNEAYSVSDDGRVWSSVSRTFLSSAPCPYPRVQLKTASGKRGFNVHSLVMLAFVGPRPPGLVVLHDNDIKTDNRLSNLRYGTYSENARDAVRNGVHYTPWRLRGEQRPDAMRTGRPKATHCPRGHRYHRDAKGYPRCSPCDAERQRNRRADNRRTD